MHLPTITSGAVLAAFILLSPASGSPLVERDTTPDPVIAAKHAPATLQIDSAIWTTLNMTDLAKKHFEKPNGVLEILLHKVRQQFGDPWPGGLSLKNRKYGAPTENLDIMFHISNNTKQKFGYTYEFPSVSEMASPFFGSGNNTISLDHVRFPVDGIPEFQVCCPIRPGFPFPTMAVPAGSPVEILGASSFADTNSVDQEQPYAKLYEAAIAGREFALTPDIVGEEGASSHRANARTRTITVWYTHLNDTKVRFLSGPYYSMQRFT
ncbi:hypothetical protein MBLNU457_4339t1 [Dothideomycetes sp. NU457]